MKYFIYIILAALVFTGCKQEDISKEISFATLEYRPINFTIYNHTEALPIVINNELKLKDFFKTQEDIPTIDFTKNTLLVGKVCNYDLTEFKLEKDKQVFVFKVIEHYYSLGTQACPGSYYFAIIPKAEKDMVKFETETIRHR